MDNGNKSNAIENKIYFDKIDKKQTYLWQTE